MSETKAQFLDRLYGVAENATPRMIEDREAVHNAARAVYAQALRDFIEEFGGYRWNDEEDDLLPAIQEFAAERGIDIENAG